MLQLIELGAEVEYIDIDTSKIPYTFSIKLTDKTYSFTVRYNDVGGFFTIDLSVANTGEVLAYGDRGRAVSLARHHSPMPYRGRGG